MKPYNFIFRLHVDVLIEKTFVANGSFPSFVFDIITPSSVLLLPHLLLILTCFDDFFLNRRSVSIELFLFPQRRRNSPFIALERMTNASSMLLLLVMEAILLVLYSHCIVPVAKLSENLQQACTQTFSFNWMGWS